jgi:recombination protein RecT
VQREVMTVDEVEQVRNVSKAKNSGPWKDWWSEMAKKTCIRRLCKMLPSSVEMSEFWDRDDQNFDLDNQRVPVEVPVEQIPALQEVIEQAPQELIENEEEEETI